MWASMYCNALFMNSSDSWTGWPLALNRRSVFSRCRMRISYSAPSVSCFMVSPLCASAVLFSGSDGSGCRNVRQVWGREMVAVSWTGTGLRRSPYPSRNRNAAATSSCLQNSEM